MISGVPLLGVCGHTNISCRVVNGKLVENGKWPWQVSILFLGVYVCSGSLFHQQWVLTAAHCLQRSRNQSEYTVKVGSQDFTQTNGQLRVSSIVVHENFNNLVSKDIALLKLENSISWSYNVQPVCLPSSEFKPSLGSLCWVIGWGPGDTQGTLKTNSYNLHEVAVRIINNEVCNQKYRFLIKKGQKNFLGKDMLCGNSEQGMNFCQANSGSALVCHVNNIWIQMGVVSWSFSCSQSQYPGIYTSTSHFTQWIKIQVSDVRFISGASAAFLRPFFTSYILLVSLSSLWLL
ncbi:serine protease 46-like [Rhynchocyon petersi]